MEVRTRRWLAAVLLLFGLVTALRPSWTCAAEMAAIRAYQIVGSPVLGRIAKCPFTPTCSEYALQSLREDGLFVGNWRIAKRLARCSPLRGLMPEG